VELECAVQGAPLLRQGPAGGIPTEIGASAGHPLRIDHGHAIDDRQPM
jgi:hypothetical protein